MVISLSNVSKSFTLTPVNSMCGHLINLKNRPAKEVIKETSLTFSEGEAVSIIGRNGSGKSTLLKLISKILKPTSGKVEVSGRVCSLLELGSGFNDLFTGYENARLTCSIYGVSKSAFKYIIPKIEEYAEINEYINYPVSTYSSGMKLRLAFAIFANLSPDILIIDEALSVGDMFFRKKCFNTISNHFNDGKTLIFTSHNEDHIRYFSKRTIVLENGSIIYDGDTEKAIEIYHNSNSSKRRRYFDNLEKNLAVKRSDKVQDNIIYNCHIYDINSERKSYFNYDNQIELYFEINYKTRSNFYAGILIRNKEGFNVYSVEKKIENNLTGFKSISFKFINKLGRNSYFVEVYVVDRSDGTTNILDWVYDAISFNVEYELPNKSTNFKGGVVDLNATIQIC